MSDYDVLVVGAGYAGSIMAERLASQRGLRVLVIDRRPHIAGNAHDYLDEHGVLVHAYGPHIFHTKSQRRRGLPLAVHRVDAVRAPGAWRSVDGKHLPMPINRTTHQRAVRPRPRAPTRTSRPSTPSAREPIEHVRTSEDAVVAKVGRDLYEKFFRGYTRKQWERDPSELHASVCARIPMRTNTDDRYFSDGFQAHAGGRLHGDVRADPRPPGHRRPALSTDFEDVRDEVDYDHLVYTGPIDELLRPPVRARCPTARCEFELRNEPTPDGGLPPPGRLDQRAERGRARTRARPSSAG